MDFRGFTTKKRIQRLVFPSGIGYDTQNDAVRTLKTNLLFSLISIAQRELLKTKNGKSIQMNQFSVRVTSTCKTSNFLEDIQHILSSDFF